MTLWSLTFVGTGGFHSAGWKGFPCSLLDTGSSRVMFDCGDGSLAAMRSMQGPRVPDLALLSGATAEEMLGLVGVSDWAGTGRRSAPLSVIGPRGTTNVLDSLLKLKRGRKSQVRVQEAIGEQVVFENSALTITAFELLRDTDDPGLGYLVQEKSLPGRVDVEAARRLGLSGPDIGRLVKGDSLDGVDPTQVVGPSRPGRRLVIAGRTRPNEELQHVLSGADAAVLAAAYIDERWDVAASTGCMTGWEAAQAASSARVRLLALYNVSGSNPDRVVRLEAQQYHPNVFVPSDGDRLEIPSRDALAGPALVRLQQRGPQQARDAQKPANQFKETRSGPRRSPSGKSSERNRNSDRRRS